MKQRWEAKTIVNNLRDAEVRLYKTLPSEVEQHTVTKAIKDEAKIVEELKKASTATTKLIYNAEIQELNLIKVIRNVKDALNKQKQGAQAHGYLGRSMQSALKRAEGGDRQEYRDVMSIIDESHKGHDDLRQAIRTMFRKMDTQNVFAKLAARSEAKITKRAISNIQKDVEAIQKAKDQKEIESLIRDIEKNLKKAFLELFVLKKRALLWAMKIINDLYYLRGKGIQYVRMHYMPSEPQKKEDHHIDTIIQKVFADFQMIAQGFRRMINQLQTAEKELAKQ